MEEFMLQKLENAYLAILRFVVIFVAGILLVAVVILGFNSLKAIMPEPKIELTPKVSEEDIIKGIINPTGIAQNQTPSAANEIKQEQTDNNLAAYDRAATTIVQFVQNNTGGKLILEKSRVIAFIKESANKEAQGNPKLVTTFATNFADSIEKTLKDKSVIEAAKKSTPGSVVEKAFYIYTVNFKQQIENQNNENQIKQQDYLLNKSKGIASLQIAAGAFGAFLLIVFLSVIIKIERNLRPAENK